MMSRTSGPPKRVICTARMQATLGDDPVAAVRGRPEAFCSDGKGLPGTADVPAQDSGSSWRTSRSGISSTVTGAGAAGPKTLVATAIVPLRTYCM
jgi:hypothetical protein